MRHTVEMLEFCAEHGITADVEVLPSSAVETALNRLSATDVHYRFVLDMSDLDTSASQILRLAAGIAVQTVQQTGAHISGTADVRDAGRLFVRLRPVRPAG